MLKRFRGNTENLPELFVFTDDHQARGGLIAMATLGISVPEDVRVVTLANKGDVPAFPLSLTRIEVDPVKWGMLAAQCVRSYLDEGRLPDNVFAEGVYIKGETFA